MKQLLNIIKKLAGTFRLAERSGYSEEASPTVWEDKGRGEGPSRLERGPSGQAAKERGALAYVLITGGLYTSALTRSLME